MGDKQDDAELQHCDHREHGDEKIPAVALYEGTTPPGRTFRFAACSEHAPDAPPIKYLDERLITDGGHDRNAREDGDAGVSRRNGYLFGRVPFGPNHEHLTGRLVYNGYIAMRGFLFASGLFAIAYWGQFGAIDSPLHLLVFLSLVAHGMEGSFYQRQKRFADFVDLRRGESHD